MILGISIIPRKGDRCWMEAGRLETIESIGRVCFPSSLEATHLSIDSDGDGGAMVLAANEPLKKLKTLGGSWMRGNRSLASSPSEMLEKSDKEVAARGFVSEKTGSMSWYINIERCFVHYWRGGSTGSSAM